MKVLIVSDTHKRNENFFRVLEKVSPVDMVIHCGDIEGSEYVIAEGAGCPVEMVAGNNDFFTTLPLEREFELGKYHMWVTHGHNYYVSMGNEHLKQEARIRGVDIVFYGHTHRPLLDLNDDVIAVNPGSLSYPRQDGRKPSYVLMDIDRFGEVHFTLRFL
ncbi:MAG: metallophosphoesterase [Lachnospiraceae bacterium]|nr:metallophosphoesterase [Lachnospiraceae bacterium]MDE6128924.1 metallophosphoesterase [Lachnospiraceae bacterium]